MRRVRFNRYFPLTLTLSLREREQQASDGSLAYGRWGNSGTSVVSKWWTILPLPDGEGRGEGEPRGAHPTGESFPEKQVSKKVTGAQSLP
jgi:hypothetical protein